MEKGAPCAQRDEGRLSTLVAVRGNGDGLPVCPPPTRFL